MFAFGTDRSGRGGLLAPAMLAVAALLGGGTSASADESIGGAEIVVNQVKGNLTTGRVVAVLRGDDVYRDEGVRTVADSTAKLVLRDNTVLTVGPSSFVKLDRFVYAGEGQRGAVAVNLVKGALEFTTGNAAKHSYLITTPTAALGVRGTIFRIDATAFKTVVTLEEGAIDVCMRFQSHRCVDLDHPGQQAAVTNSQVAVTADPASAAPGGTTVGVTGHTRGGPPQAAQRPVLGPAQAAQRAVLGPAQAAQRAVLGPAQAAQRPVLGPGQVAEAPAAKAGWATVKAVERASASAKEEATAMDMAAAETAVTAAAADACRRAQTRRPSDQVPSAAL